MSATGKDQEADGDPQRPIIVGRVTAVFGIRGWVKIASFTDPPENLLGYRPWLLASGTGFEPVEVDELKVHGNGFVAQLDGCTDRDLAARFTGRDLAVPRSELPAAEPDEYYWFDLAGLEVVSPSGEPLGRVTRVLETGANDVLVVRGAEREILIPFVAAVVTDVDLADGRLTADWQEPE